MKYTTSMLSSRVVDDMNILQATMESMHMCLDKMCFELTGIKLETPFDHIIVDGNYFKQYDGKPHTCVVKGDNIYYAIAAASIIAKVTRDEYMVSKHSEYPEYGWDSNKGYGSKKHIETIKELGVTPLHRMSFLNKILQS